VVERNDIVRGAGVNRGGQEGQLSPGGLPCSLGGSEDCSYSHQHLLGYPSSTTVTNGSSGTGNALT